MAFPPRACLTKQTNALLSDPIVTPVTDEFPTDEQNEKEEAKDKDQKTAGDTVKRFKPGAKDLSVDYGAKKHKTGAERCVSDPIVTPVTDEFATEDEGTEAKDKAMKTDGKQENKKEENGKEKKKNNGKKG
ncbi:unnamed protein product [Cylicostephanus goldi]|uniref:Uncharacterized protein n=1 Tax=Cylicostephanus goldi TaxID=71465 RepID=A0A3P7MD90_CYLGO|nr:unnamed protein product [Cylicostephanus goldi]